MSDEAIEFVYLNRLEIIMSDFLNMVVKSFLLFVKPYKGIDALIGLVNRIGI